MGFGARGLRVRFPSKGFFNYKVRQKFLHSLSYRTTYKVCLHRVCLLWWVIGDSCTGTPALSFWLLSKLFLCCTVSMTPLQILHVTFRASCMTPLGASCSCHGLMLHCQHGFSLNLLDNLPSFCQLFSDCLLRSTTPQILHTFTLVLRSRVHTF